MLNVSSALLHGRTASPRGCCGAPANALLRTTTTIAMLCDETKIVYMTK